MSRGGYWLLRHPEGLIIDSGATPPDFLRERGEAFASLGQALEIGQWRGHPCYAAEYAGDPRALGETPVSLHGIHGRIGMEAFALAGRGVQLLDWRRQHRYCGACATPTQRLADEHAMQCPACGLLAYPRLSPAMMVLVKRGAELLLARGPRFPPGVYSALAGFVEPGETLEQCVEREVREEVGIEVTNLRYFGSQPWPFPNSLMVAFTADYAGGLLRPDPRELEDAAWFPVDALPLMPTPASIAHRLIDALRWQNV